MAKDKVGGGQYGLPRDEDGNVEVRGTASDYDEMPEPDLVDYEDEDGEVRRVAAPYHVPKSPADEVLKGVKRSEKSEQMLLMGKLEEDFLIFGDRMKIRMRTLPVGEKAKVAMAVEQTGSMLGLQSYKLLTLVETFARSIISIDGEPVAPSLEDEQYIDPDEQYKRNRRVIEKWNEESLTEIYNNAWLPLLDLETKYYEEAKKD